MGGRPKAPPCWRRGGHHEPGDHATEGGCTMTRKLSTSELSVHASGGRSGGLAQTRELHRSLRALGRVAPPPGLLGNVLDDLGLNDRYVAVETPIGAVF